jgi:dienelactone hydrolase
MQAKAFITIAVVLLSCRFTMAQQEALEAPPRPPLIEFGPMEHVASWGAGEEYVTTFPSAVASENPENENVPIHILLPKSGRAPFPSVVILHYWGALNRNVERQQALELNKRGIAAILMTLPYHLERTPKGTRSGELAIQPDPEKLKTTLLQSVQDTRRAVDFVQSRTEFDPNKIGVSGLSLGAIVASLVYGMEPRISHAAFVLGGVDIAHILWYSSRVVPQREEMRSRGFTEEKLRQALAPLEPMGYLRARPGTDAFIVAARYDTVIPARATRELIESIENPHVSWMETGHFGGAFVQSRLLGETARYFDSAFNGTPFTSNANLGAPTIRLGVQFDYRSGMDIGFGVDIWSTGKERQYTLTPFVTPRGVKLFLGSRAGRQIAAGIIMDRKGLGVGVLWSTVL